MKLFFVMVLCLLAAVCGAVPCVPNTAAVSEQQIESASLATNTAYVSAAALKAEWALANNDTKKWAVVARLFGSLDAMEQSAKAAKEKVKKDKAVKVKSVK